MRWGKMIGKTLAPPSTTAEHPLRIARHRAGLSVAKLAALSGVPQGQIFHLEQGYKYRIYVDDLVALGTALGVPWWRLASADNLTLPTGRPPLRKRRRKA